MSCSFHMPRALAGELPASASSPDTSVSTPQEDPGPRNLEVLSGSIDVGEKPEFSDAQPTEDPANTDATPRISEALVLGEFNRGAVGTDYFNRIAIALKGENLTDDHFLSPEGLHWSDRTTIELIRGQELGPYDFSTFPRETPQAPMKTFSTNPGDSGRITHIGTTKSGIELDLIWTVIGSDKDDWTAHSGFANKRKVKGLGFTGAQFISGGAGNSIVVLYNDASNLGLQYQIVRHGTTIEQPVIASFISADIDSAQGVETNLANIIEIIPEDSHLEKQDGIIYDATRGVVNLNGEQDLPHGGYLGAGFISNFSYIFYSPAPQRVHNSYYYPIGVRYDLFGSSLQVELLPKIQQSISIRYEDTLGRVIKPDTHYKGFLDESYRFDSLLIPHYRLTNIKKDTEDPHHTHITFVYTPLHTVTFHFVDEAGNSLSEARDYEIPENKELSYEPLDIEGYYPPAAFHGAIIDTTVYAFVYKKIPPQPTPQASPTQTPKARTRKARSVAVTPSEGPVTPGNELIPRKPTDHFLINTHMRPDQKEMFFQYIAEVKADAQKKYGNDIHKINHAIANAIAYPSYAKDDLQSKVNDFGKQPNVSNYTDVAKELSKIHQSPYYYVDFPHLATTLASAETSSPPKEAFKILLGLNHASLYGNNPKNNFFLLNSLTGDVMTYIDFKDRVTDMDAMILHYHEKYKDLSLDDAISQYYHTHNLSAERERLYEEVLRKQAGSVKNVQELENNSIITSALTPAGLTLLLLRSTKSVIADPYLKFFALAGGFITTAAVIGGLSMLSMFKNLEKLRVYRKEFDKQNLNQGRQLIVKSVSKSIKNFNQKRGNTMSNRTYTKVLRDPYPHKSLTMGAKIIHPVYKPYLQKTYPNYMNRITQSIRSIAKSATKVINYAGEIIDTYLVKPARKFINTYIVEPVVNFFKRF